MMKLLRVLNKRCVTIYAIKDLRTYSYANTQLQCVSQICKNPRIIAYTFDLALQKL